MITDVGIVSLLDILDEEGIRKLCRHFKGCRIYFPKVKSEHDEIRKLYEHMIKNGNEKTAIKRLSIIFDKSEKQIKRVIRYKRGLFDEI